MSFPPSLLLITPLSGRTGLILTPYSARGVKQTLEQIKSVGGGAAKGLLIRRDINGNLVNLTFDQFRKYESVVSCDDREVPCMDDAWIGEIVTVECACELNYPTGGSPQRTAVSGSSRTDAHGFTWYRPQLLMMVTAIKRSFDEWHADNVWSVDLEEI